MKLQRQRGAVVVEFAIILPVLVLLVFGIIEFSIVLYDKALITNASREGARAGIIITGSVNPVPPEKIIEEVNKYLRDKNDNLRLITFATNHPLPDIDAPLPIGGQRTVTVRYTYTPLVLPKFITNLGGVINLTAETVMRME